MALDAGFPLVMVVGYRGWTRRGITPDTAAVYTEPFLHAFGIKYFLVEHDEDGDRISAAFDEAKKTRRPVVVLIGDEYHGFNR
jgi:sulfopyruvate decarboxylase TPP-binding subunit